MDDYFRIARKYADGGAVSRGHYGYSSREPYESENTYFRANPHVGGMASEDGKIVLNPFTTLAPNERDAVARNEAARLYMREAKPNFDFDPTPEQRRSFEGTPYASDPAAMRETLIARIISGDPSAGNVTEQQRAWASRIKSELENRSDGMTVPRYARGGPVAAPKFATKVPKLTSGGLDSALPGRSDKLGIGAKPGAFVMPADVVAAVGEGNSKAGMKVLDGMFKSGPYGSHLPRPGARSAMPRRGKPAKFADGGVVPIAVSGGEYIIEPEEIEAQFGDIETGHKALEQFAKDQRKAYIKTLRSLPGPRRG